jgi:hypothetical protein
MPAERPFRTTSLADLVGELAETGPGPTTNGWLMLVGDRMAGAAEALAVDYGGGDGELADDVMDFAKLWRFLRGQDE